jgi:hypothetical protein
MQRISITSLAAFLIAVLTVVGCTASPHTVPTAGPDATTAGPISDAGVHPLTAPQYITVNGVSVGVTPSLQFPVADGGSVCLLGTADGGFGCQDGGGGGTDAAGPFTTKDIVWDGGYGLVVAAQDAAIQFEDSGTIYGFANTSLGTAYALGADQYSTTDSTLCLGYGNVSGVPPTCKTGGWAVKNDGTDNWINVPGTNNLRVGINGNSASGWYGGVSGFGPITNFLMGRTTDFGGGFNMISLNKADANPTCSSLAHGSAIYADQSTGKMMLCNLGASAPIDFSAAISASACTSGQILVANSTPTLTCTTASGDWTISNAGVSDIASLTGSGGKVTVPTATLDFGSSYATTGTLNFPSPALSSKQTLVAFANSGNTTGDIPAVVAYNNSAYPELLFGDYVATYTTSLLGQVQVSMQTNGGYGLTIDAFGNVTQIGPTYSLSNAYGTTTIKTTAETSDVSPVAMQIMGASAYASAATNTTGGNLILAPGSGATTSGTAGNVIANIPSSTTGTTHGGFVVEDNSVFMGALGSWNPASSASYGALWIGPSAVTRTTSNAVFVSDGSSIVELNAPASGTLYFQNGNNNVAVMTAAGLSVGSSTPSFGGGSGGMLGIVNATTVPTGACTGGICLYSDSGALETLASGFQFNYQATSPVFTEVAPTTDVAPTTITLKGQNAYASAVTNTTGGALVLSGGAGTTSPYHDGFVMLGGGSSGSPPTMSYPTMALGTLLGGAVVQEWYSLSAFPTTIPTSGTSAVAYQSVPGAQSTPIKQAQGIFAIMHGDGTNPVTTTFVPEGGGTSNAQSRTSIEYEGVVTTSSTAATSIPMSGSSSGIPCPTSARHTGLVHYRITGRSNSAPSGGSTGDSVILEYTCVILDNAGTCSVPTYWGGGSPTNCVNTAATAGGSSSSMTGFSFAQAIVSSAVSPEITAGNSTSTDWEARATVDWN